MKNEYLESLKGISLKDWKILKVAVDRVFEQKKGELEKEIKLANTEIVSNIILEQFEQTLD